MQNPGKALLLVVYNKRLKEETRAKAKALRLRNLRVESFHSACVQFYGAKDAQKDPGIQRVCESHAPLAQAMAFDIIIVDESQARSSRRRGRHRAGQGPGLRLECKLVGLVGPAGHEASPVQLFVQAAGGQPGALSHAGRVWGCAPNSVPGRPITPSPGPGRLGAARLLGPLRYAVP